MPELNSRQGIIPCTLIRALCTPKMHRILGVLTAFVFPDKYDVGILAAPKPHKAACSIVLLYKLDCPRIYINLIPRVESLNLSLTLPRYKVQGIMPCRELIPSIMLGIFFS